MFMSVLPLNASAITAFETHPGPAAVDISERSPRLVMSVLESLREDVVSHPSDFITFETQTTANRFIVEHADAQQETERRVVLRGIIGYWQGKILVVLPSLSTNPVLRYYPFARGEMAP
jgi:hypothetical protein